MDSQLKVLLDVTVILDAIVNADESDGLSKEILDLAAGGRIRGYVCAAAIEQVGDLLIRSSGSAAARSHLQRILAILTVAPVDAATLDGAMSLGYPYLDDALTAQAARQINADILLTLNTEDFDESPSHPSSPRFESPETFLRNLSN